MVRRIVKLTVAIELVTLFFRVILGLKSTRDTKSTIGRLTRGIRIHHSYPGIIYLLYLSIFRSKSSLMVVFSWALILSDLLHHFLLYLFTGSAEFDLYY